MQRGLAVDSAALKAGVEAVDPEERERFAKKVPDGRKGWKIA